MDRLPLSKPSLNRVAAEAVGVGGNAVAVDVALGGDGVAVGSTAVGVGVDVGAREVAVGVGEFKGAGVFVAITVGVAVEAAPDDRLA